MRRVGVLLSGCGRYDGTEVREAVLVSLAVRRRGYRIVYLAPDIAQQDVVDHLSGNVTEGAAPREVRGESARLAGGPVRAVSEVASSELDALVIPGGGGAVRHLCLPGDGPLGGGELRPEIARLLDDLERRGAPVGAVGLARIVLARHGDRPLDNDPVAFAPTDVEREDGGRVTYTPGFMGTDDIAEVAVGIERMIDAVGERLGGGEGTRR